MSGSIASLGPAIGMYDTIQLIQYVRNLKLPTSFLLDTFFPNRIESETPKVAIDVDVGKRRMAPFCSPLVEGRFVESRRYQTNEFVPPYIKDKRRPDLLKPVRRAIGERIGGQLTPMQRFQANLAFEVEDQIQMVDRRLEWMAAQALLTGTVLVTGDGYEPTLVNFGRDPALTVALSGAAAWGQPGVSPTAYITTWSASVLQKSGATVTDLVFTNTPWEAFLADIRIINAVLAPKAGGVAIDFGGAVPKGGMYMGNWGQFRCWLYNEWYVDPDTDLESPMLPDGTVILGGPEMEGTRAFGCIYDPKFNYGPLAYAPKMWTEEDPAGLNLMMQSSPLVIPSRVNAAMAATVMTAGGIVTQPTF